MTQTGLHGSKEGLPTLQERHLPPSSRTVKCDPCRLQTNVYCVPAIQEGRHLNGTKCFDFCNKWSQSLFLR